LIEVAWGILYNGDVPQEAIDGEGAVEEKDVLALCNDLMVDFGTRNAVLASDAFDFDTGRPGVPGMQFDEQVGTPVIGTCLIQESVVIFVGRDRANAAIRGVLAGENHSLPMGIVFSVFRILTLTVLTAELFDLRRRIELFNPLDRFRST